MKSLNTIMVKSRDYETLVSGMRKVPTIFDAEEVIRKYYPLKLPNRMALQMFNSPELSQFRGLHDGMEK